MARMTKEERAAKRGKIAERFKNYGAILRYTFKCIRYARLHGVLFVVTFVLAALVVPANTLLTAYVANAFAQSGSVTPAVLVALAGAAFTMCAGPFLQNITLYSSNMISLHSELPIKQELFEAVSRIDVRTREMKDTAEEYNEVNSTVGQFGDILIFCVGSACMSLISVISSFIIILSVSPLVALISLVMLCVSTRIGIKVGKLRFSIFESYQYDAIRENKVRKLIDDRYVFAELKAARKTAWITERWGELFDTFTKKYAKGQVSDTLGGAAPEIVASLASYAVFAAYGIAGTVNASSVVLLVNSTLATNEAISELVSNLSYFEYCGSILAQYFAFLDGKYDSVRGMGENATPADITAQGLTFSYDGEKNAVDGIDLTIRAGEHIALVGENGSGKTTLAKLILQLYRPTAGTLEFSGAGFSRATALLQDYARYMLTVRENIGLGDISRMDEGDAMEALYRTVTGSGLVAPLDEAIGPELGGRDLSGGEWQKLALARAFFREAPLVVLDEPNSAIDAFTEATMIKSIESLTRNKTSVIITHRLTTTALADRIIVMKGGRICEEGSHQELMARDGEYARMYRVQSEAYSEQSDDPAVSAQGI